MTPYSLAFYVDAVTTGTVLGLGPADSPERVAEVFGADCGENAGRGVLSRDYGLVEFHWQRSHGGDPWEGHHISVQVHRLAYRRGALVDGVLRTRYGRFAPRIRFDKLRRLLERRGVPLVEIPEYAANTPYYRTYWQPASRVTVSVIGTYGEYRTPGNLRVGDVYRIQVPVTAEEVAARRARAARVT
ncbi:hypothetical protein GCM10010302_01420 [Streptomyces polychromogenes]|uniref:Uncharacterized protein n=1 Tax=Streptomyces polychromogenes TaxID=67342 RepID=A0ABP3EKG8_9ACTN